MPNTVAQTLSDYVPRAADLLILAMGSSGATPLFSPQPASARSMTPTAIATVDLGAIAHLGWGLTGAARRAGSPLETHIHSEPRAEPPAKSAGRRPA